MTERIVKSCSVERQEFVATHMRDESGDDESLLRLNLGQQMRRIIRRVGLEPWPKTFQNLRSTRETELAETFPLHVVCKWIGNSEPVTAKHYLQLTEEHFERAVATGEPTAGRRSSRSSGRHRKVTQNPVSQMHETGRKRTNGSEKLAVNFLGTTRLAIIRRYLRLLNSSDRA